MFLIKQSKNHSDHFESGLFPPFQRPWNRGVYLYCMSRMTSRRWLNAPSLQ
jgi:hypothetical protein